MESILKAYLDNEKESARRCCEKCFSWYLEQGQYHAEKAFKAGWNARADEDCDEEKRSKQLDRAYEAYSEFSGDES